MCGIAGVFTKKNVNLNKEHWDRRRKIFIGLLIAMQERGSESAGVAFVDKNRLSIVKKPVSALKFINNSRFKALMRENVPVVIGHTRWATMGDVVKRNAHPFLRGNIVGVHNGIVGNVSNFERFNRTLEVDSELIFSLLNESNNDYKKTFRKLRGNFAIAWTKIAKDDYELFLVRDDNPLYIAYVKELKSYFYCSTREALRIVLLSHYSKAKIEEIVEDVVFNIKSDLSVTEEKVKFKSYFFSSFNNRTDNDESEKYNGDSSGYGEDDSPMDREFCENCQLEIASCACEPYKCDRCDALIIMTYFKMPNGQIVCSNCYSFKKTKGVKCLIKF